MQSEFEKLRQAREAEIRCNKQTSLYLQERNTSKVVSTIFAILGFLKSCNQYMDGFAHGAENVIQNRAGSGIFLFLDLVIFPAIGALIGWILIKIIFSIIRANS